MPRQAFHFMATILAVVLAPLEAAAATCGPNGCVVAPPLPQRPAGVAPRPEQANAAVVRIVHRGASGASLGTGTLIGHSQEASYFLTCAHLFDALGRTEVRRGADRAEARVIALDRRHDLALLSTRRVEGKPVESSMSTAAGELMACGYGSSGAYRCVRGPIVGFATASGASEPSLRIRGAVRSGDSGGPVFDRVGRLVAVIWGQRDGETYAMGGRPLRAILAKVPRRLAPVRRSPSKSGPIRDSDPWRDQVESRLEALTRRPATPPQPLPADLLRRGDLRGLTNEWNKRFDRLEGRLADAASPRANTANDTLLSGRLSRDLLLTGVGIGGPAALGLFVGRALWKWSRHRRSRSDTAEALQLEATKASRPIAVDSPPPPQQVVPETHYVSYERDEFAKAHQWASEQIARKFPGSVEMLSSLDSLIRQQLNANQR